jgi:hypothetical protein
MLSITGVVGQSSTIIVTPVPSNGIIDAGSGSFCVDIPGVMTLYPSEDGLSCVITGITPGICNVTWNGTSRGVPIFNNNAFQCTIINPLPPAAIAGHIRTFRAFSSEEDRNLYTKEST